ncbi:hypothetical protein C0993_006176 [Termitomyces sp. T159_Od127]|nr:hypothetical protein C0993_006176 [Termitomyces sp. T159_Od127]
MDDDNTRLPNRVYNDLTLSRMSLRRFNRLTRAIWATRDSDAFIRFVLSGEFVDEDGEVRQAFLDPLQNLVQPVYPLQVTRDYDSLLGIATKIMVQDNISVFAVPHPTFALKASVHVTVPVVYQDTATFVELHRIPNFEFGKFGPRHHLHVFFPALWTPERAKSRQPYLLTKREREIWYECGLRPAIVKLLDEHMASEWPATCETEEIRARTARGTFSWATKVIPDHVVPSLADEIRRAVIRSYHVSIEERMWATSFLVLHTVRGTKSITYHRLEPLSVEYYFYKFLRDSRLSRDVYTEGEWYVDVAIEISNPAGDCLQWTTAGHQRLVQQILRIDDDNAERITSLNSTKYSRDYSSHLSALSGCRIVPGTRAQGEFRAKYLQAYTTDKAVTYNNDGRHHAKFITSKEAMAPTHPAPTIAGLHTIFEQAIENNGCNARVEVRVPIDFAMNVLYEFDSEEIRRCLCAFSRRTWWGFRLSRLMGASQVLSLQASGSPELRVHPQALALTAGCVWLVNGLHARPEDGPAARQLMDAALPITEADEAGLETAAYRRALPRQRIIERNDREVGDEDIEDIDEDEEEDEERQHSGEVAYNPYGLVFFRRIKVEDTPRFRHGGPTLLDGAIKFWFGMTAEQLESKYNSNGLVDKDVVGATRSKTNRRRLPQSFIADEPQPDLFNVGAPGQQLPQPALDEGSDVEDAETPPPPASLNEFLSDLYRTFVVDLTCKSPNPRGSTRQSYVKLTTQQRLDATEDVYKTLVLSDIFTHVAYKITPIENWEQAFNWLFPKRGQEISTSIQNYPTCPYYKKWRAFANDAANDARLVSEARKAIWARIKTWSWLPDAQQDKMWPTSLRNVTGFIRCPDLRSNGRWLDAAPRILVKPRVEYAFEVEVEEE